MRRLPRRSALGVAQGYAGCTPPLFARIATSTQPRQNASETAPRNVAGFLPLAQWRAAVLSGDKSAIGRFYVPDPNAPAPMQDGKNPTAANAEPAFWAGLKAQGLVAFNPKLLQEESPQPGTIFLVLRVEMTFAAAHVPDAKISSPHDRDASDLTARGAACAHITATRRNPRPSRWGSDFPAQAGGRPIRILYPAPAIAQRDLDEALAEARADHKRVLGDASARRGATAVPRARRRPALAPGRASPWPRAIT